MQLLVRRAVSILLFWNHTAVCVLCANQDEVLCAWEYARMLYKRSTRRLDFRRGRRAAFPMAWSQVCRLLSHSCTAGYMHDAQARGRMLPVS